MLVSEVGGDDPRVVVRALEFGDDLWQHRTDDRLVQRAEEHREQYREQDLHARAVVDLDGGMRHLDHPACSHLGDFRHDSESPGCVRPVGCDAAWWLT